MNLACITYWFAWSAVVIVRDLLRARVDSIRFDFDKVNSIKINSVGYIRRARAIKVDTFRGPRLIQ